MPVSTTPVTMVRHRKRQKLRNRDEMPHLTPYMFVIKESLIDGGSTCWPWAVLAASGAKVQIPHLRLLLLEHVNSYG